MSGKPQSQEIKKKIHTKKEVPGLSNTKHEVFLCSISPRNISQQCMTWAWKSQCFVKLACSTMSLWLARSELQFIIPLPLFSFNWFYRGSCQPFLSYILVKIKLIIVLLFLYRSITYLFIYFYSFIHLSIYRHSSFYITWTSLEISM